MSTHILAKPLRLLNYTLVRLPIVILRALILAPLCLWSFANWWHTARDVSHFYIDFPVWDYFATIEHYARYKAGDLTVFWTQHNEHRIVFPELIFAADLLWFRGQIVLPLVLSFSFYFGIWLTIVYALSCDSEIAVIPRYSAALLAAILLAWTGAAHPLASPILLQWTLSQFAAIVALAFLAKASRNHDPRWLVYCVTCGVIASYSSANGLTVWPLLIGLALCLRFGWRRISIILASATFSICMYFIGYRQLGPIRWQVLLSHPTYLAKFIATYASMPFAFLRSEPEFAIHVGFVSLTALTLLFLQAWRKRMLFSPTGIILLGYAAFLLLSGVMIAAGRMNLDDPTFEDAKAVRFLTMPLSYWAMLAAALVWILARVRVVGTALSVTIVIALSLLLFRMSHKSAFAAFYHSVTESYATQQWAALAVENGVVDPNPDLILYPDARLVPRLLPILRAEKLCLFAKTEPSWIGRDATSIFRVSTQPPAHGGIVASHNLETAVTVAGWTDVKNAKIVLIDESNRIVGLGEHLPAGLPKCFETLTTPLDLQWVGFVNRSYGSQIVSPYIVAADQRSLSPIPTEFKIEP